MSERTRISVGEAVYELRPWGYKDGRRWLYRLASMATAAGAGTDAQTVASMLERLGETHFEELCETVEKYTDVVSMSEGREAVMPLSKIAATHMPRRHTDLAMLLRAHLEEEYADFFARLPEVLGRGGGRAS